MRTDFLFAREHLNVVFDFKTVKLIQQLEHRALHFTITRLITIETLGTNRILYDSNVRESSSLCKMRTNSSIKMMAGAFSLPSMKASRTSLAPSPMNICTNCEAANCEPRKLRIKDSQAETEKSFHSHVSKSPSKSTLKSVLRRPSLTESSPCQVDPTLALP